MKTITTLIGLALLSGVALASSTLNLALNGGNSYTIFLDGAKYQTSSTIRFQDLYPGRHTLSVINKDQHHPTSLYNGFVDIEDGEVLYGTITNGSLTVSNQNTYNNHNDYSQLDDYNNYGSNNTNHYQYGMNQQVYNQLHDDLSCATDSRKGRLLVNKAQRHGINTKQAKHLLAKFSFDSHRLTTAKQLTSYVVDRENYWTVGETFTFSSSKRNFLNHLNNGGNNQNNNGSCTIPRPQPNNNHNHHSNSYGMNQQAFQILIRSVREESFDNNRKQQVLSVVKNSRISAQQMTQILKEFTFDSNRLTTAKAVIPYVTDKENFWMAGETFTFSSNKNSFLKAL